MESTTIIKEEEVSPVKEVSLGTPTIKIEDVKPKKQLSEKQWANLRKMNESNKLRREEQAKQKKSLLEQPIVAPVVIENTTTVSPTPVETSNVVLVPSVKEITKVKKIF